VGLIGRTEICSGVGKRAWGKSKVYAGREKDVKPWHSGGLAYGTRAFSGGHFQPSLRT
jgi:hypothetical protein